MSSCPRDLTIADQISTLVGESQLYEMNICIEVICLINGHKS